MEREKIAPWTIHLSISKSTILAPLRVRNVRLLLTGQMLSTVGDMCYAVALPWFMLTHGYTAQELGIVLACYGLPRLAAMLPGGLLSDRFSARRIMLLADTLRALLVGILVVLISGGHTPLWQRGITYQKISRSVSEVIRFA